MRVPRPRSRAPTSTSENGQGYDDFFDRRPRQFDARRRSHPPGRPCAARHAATTRTHISGTTSRACGEVARAIVDILGQEDPARQGGLRREPRRVRRVAAARPRRARRDQGATSRRARRVHGTRRRLPARRRRSLGEVASRLCPGDRGGQRAQCARYKGDERPDRRRTASTCCCTTRRRRARSPST